MNEGGSWWIEGAPDDLSGRHGDEWRCIERSEYPVMSKVTEKIRGSIDKYVGVVRENEEDVVVVNADLNVVRDARVQK